MRSTSVAAVLLTLLALPACGLLDRGTTLRLDGDDDLGVRFDDITSAAGASYLRLSGIDVCTDGDAKVEIIGVRFVGADAPIVVAFRVGRDRQADGAGRFSRISSSPISSSGGPSRPFRQPCDERGDGRTSLTLDAKVGTLPVQVRTIEVTYRADGKPHVTRLAAPVVLCGPSTGCPPGPDDEDASQADG